MPIIEVDHVSKEFRLGALTGLGQTLLNASKRVVGRPISERERFKALDDVSFRVEAGEVLGIIGHNGAGKSTLLNCVSGITRPTQGRVWLDAAVLSALPPATVAGRGIGRVFQHPELVVDLPARENLLIACHRSLGYGLVSEILKLPNVWSAEREAARRVDEVLDRLGCPTALSSRSAICLTVTASWLISAARC